MAEVRGMGVEERCGGLLWIGKKYASTFAMDSLVVIVDWINCGLIYCGDFQAIVSIAKSAEGVGIDA